MLMFAHLGVAVPDLDKAIASYKAIFGYDVVDGPYDDPIQRVRVVFMGDVQRDGIQVELVAPLDGDSPIGKVLERGTGAYHTCYEVEDLAAALAELRRQGCALVAKPVPAVAFGGRHIAWMYLPSRQLVELLSRT